MKAGDRIGPGLRVKAALSTNRGDTSYVLAERGRRQPRWVLKWAGETGEGEIRARLRRDFSALASLRHPTLALPVHLGRDRETNRAFLLRAYTPGAGIASALEGRSPQEVLAWLVASAETLELLHRFGFLHGNVKESNLIVPRRAIFRRQRAGPLVVLSDPAWWPDEASSAAGIQAGSPSGSEQRRTPGSDLRALGRVFYRLLTGRPAGRADEFPPSPSKLNSEVPLDLERVVLKLLAPDARGQYGSAGLLLKDLRLVSGDRGLGPVSVPECFLGRESELSRALRHLGDTRVPAALVVTGEAGTGKSSFLERLAVEAELMGYEALEVRCYPETDVPLAPLQALADRLISRHPGVPPLRSRLHRLLKESDPRPEPGARRLFLRRLLDYFLAAVAAPTLVLVDEAHVADPLTLEFLAELVREIATLRTRPPGDRPALSLAVSYRSEGPFRENILPLLQAVDAPVEGAFTLELAPLAAETVDGWIELALPDEPDQPGRRDAVRIPAHLRGNPLAVREAIRAVIEGEDVPVAVGSDLASVYARFFASLGGDERELLKALAVLGRPTSPDLLARVSGLSRAKLRRALGPLESREILSRESGLLFFRNGSFHHWLSANLDGGTSGSLHGRVAKILEERSGESKEEVARHWLLSDAPGRGIPAALDAARNLARSHEDRRALTFYRRVLELLPVRQKRLRRAVTEETADLCARTGELGSAVTLLEDLIRDSRDSQEAGRLHGRAGIYSNLAGEVSQAAFHLEKGLSLLERRSSPRALRERFAVEAELAEIALNRGEYSRAEAICRRALGLLGKAGKARNDLKVRRAEIALLVTLGSLRLRRFEYDEALEILSRGLQVGDELGLVPETSLVFNNLGVVHLQENRLEPAIECYERSREIASQLGQDQLLVSIESNLAVLYVKTGSTDRAADALRRAALHDARCDSTRTRFLRLHATGMVDLQLGRYASAIRAFSEAIALAEELHDVHMLAFDLVYLGECRLFRGESTAATAALDRALELGRSLPEPILPMVASRRAVLAARRGDRREAAVASGLCARRAAAGVAYLEARNRVFLGWAQRLLGQYDEAAESLDEASAFFAGVKAPAGELHAELERAAVDSDRGEVDSAHERLHRLRARHAVGQGALTNPMLSARLLLYETRVLLELGDFDLQEASSLLVEAEGYLIGRRLRDLETLASDLRRRLHLARLERGTTGAIPEHLSRDAAAAAEVVASVRSSTEGLIRALDEGEGDLERVRERLRVYEEQLLAVEHALERRRPSASPRPGTSSVVGRSSLMKRLTATIRQVAPSGLPVLITGETGTGKELVARAIHEEGSRRSAPFVTVSCAAFPEELLEAELFGYDRGAFSGAERDHPGLLRSADGGTFLFDEIGAMPPSLQGKLLRILDRGSVRPLGGTEEFHVSLRHVFSTNEDLEALVAEGRFREDLLFRIRAVELPVPALRDRIEDLPLLVRHFQTAATGEEEAPGFDDDALRLLASHPWPGNVRELQNVVTRLTLMTSGKICAEDVRRLLGDRASRRVFTSALLRSASLEQLRNELEREYLVQLHHDRGGDLNALAAALGITRRALYKRFRRLDIDPRDVR